MKYKKPTLLYFLCLGCSMSFAQKVDDQAKYNNAYSCDGFEQDRDNVAASAMTLAIE